ncbi:hypothetical protein PN836_012220 [Ningiella sp. W23]|uniref:hypothetical protein n=1 Tax=Ningiella sp. W23 TaxID=3023715 RepID=UPI003757BA46
MGIDLVPATLMNLAPKHIKIVILNGDVIGPPSVSDISLLPAGANSKTCYRSIDAFGAYNQISGHRIYFGDSVSAWWRICDNTHGKICMSNDLLRLELHDPLPWVSPEPTKPELWNIPASWILQLLNGKANEK